MAPEKCEIITDSVQIEHAGMSVSQLSNMTYLLITNSVLEREILLRKLLKTNDNMVARNIRPRAGRNKRSTSALVLRVREDAQRRPLDVDGVTGIDELLSDRRRDSRTVLEGLGLGSDVEDC